MERIISLFVGIHVFFVNIHGLIIFMSSGYFLEGDLDITDIQWIETDNLVLFDIYHIPYGEKKKMICHYSNDNDCFVFCSEIRKVVRKARGSK